MSVDWMKLDDGRPLLRHGKGDVLYLPRTGHTVVMKAQSRGGADCIVIHAPAESKYPVGGYDIHVSTDELNAAWPVEVESYAVRPPGANK
jgi:hypothetical protein